MHIFGGLNGDSFRLNVVYVITAKMPRFESQSKYFIVPNNFVLVSKLESTLVSSHINKWLVNGRKGDVKRNSKLYITTTTAVATAAAATAAFGEKVIFEQLFR